MSHERNLKYLNNNRIVYRRHPITDIPDIDNDIYMFYENGTHECYEPLMNHPQNIPHEPFEQPPQCMPDEYKDKCSIQAYWNYYIGEKHTIANLKTEKLYERRPKETY